MTVSESEKPKQLKKERKFTIKSSSLHQQPSSSATTDSLTAPVRVNEKPSSAGNSLTLRLFTIKLIPCDATQVSKDFLF